MDNLEKIYYNALINGMPSLGNFILAAIEDEKCGTAYTDGYRIFFNKAFIDGLKTEEALSVFAHEYYHIVYDHVSRGKNCKGIVSIGGQTVTLWNLAADVIVNDSISERLKFPLPDFAMRRGVGMFKDLPDDMRTTTGVYNWLNDSLDSSPPLPVPFNSDLQEPTEPQTQAEKWMVEAARKEEQRFSHEKEEMEEVMPKEVDTDWIDLVQAVAIETGKHIHLKRHKSFQRPSRYEPNGFFVRGNKTTRPKPSVSLYVDVSGSMGESPRIIMAGLKPVLSRLIFFRPSFYVFNTEIWKINKNKGGFAIGGGTDIRNVINHMKYDINIVITDCKDNVKRSDFPASAVIVSNKREFADYVTDSWEKVKKINTTKGY